MLNDRSSTLALLATRRSGRPREMIAPGPSGAELDEILTIAARVPDHGKLAPWRFIVVGEGQRDDLALLLRRALAAEHPSAPPAKHEKADEFAYQAPTLVVLVSAPVAGHKIDVWEQQLSAGAAAMSLLLAAHAMGFVGGWLTGWAAYSEFVREAFCAPGERIAGFLFLGSPGLPLEDRPRPALAEVARRWMPPTI
ncbi:MAG: nitroreductase family protein [Sphingomicrobium sp.]|nr:nitroreductase family protein [Sphingomonadales bacterium]